MATAASPIPPTGRRRNAVVARRLARYWQSWAAAIVLFVVIGRMAYDEGGYFSDSFLSAGVIAFTTVAVLLALRLPRFTVSSSGLRSLAGLAAFTAWSSISIDWSTDHATAVEAVQRDVVYVGLFALALIAAGSGRYARPLVWGALTMIVFVVGGALVSRLYPNLLHSPSPKIAGYRLNWPLGYWNALGGFGAMGVALALGLTADLRTSPVPRAIAGGAVVILATATYLTLSRGALLALAVGIVVLTVLTVRRGALAISFLLTGGGSALAIWRLQSFPALTDNPALRPGQVAAGHTFGRDLILITIGVIVLSGVVAVAHRSEVVLRAAANLRRPSQAALGGLAIAGLVLVLVVGGRISDSVSHQFDAFWSTSNSASPGFGASRIANLNGTRGDSFRVAWDGFRDHPLAGDGVGSFRNRWLRTRPNYENERNAHSLELETLSEEGLIGFALLALFIASTIGAAVRARLSPLGLGRSQAAAVSAACAVWLVHSAFDWDWQMTAMTAVALVLAATLQPARGDELEALRQAAPKPRGAAE